MEYNNTCIIMFNRFVLIQLKSILGDMTYSFQNISGNLFFIIRSLDLFCMSKMSVEIDHDLIEIWWVSIFIWYIVILLSLQPFQPLVGILISNCCLDWDSSHCKSMFKAVTILCTMSQSIRNWLMRQGSVVMKSSVKQFYDILPLYSTTHFIHLPFLLQNIPTLTMSVTGMKTNCNMNQMEDFVSYLSNNWKFRC